MKIRIEHDISDSDLFDVLVTAFEGGIDYWGSASVCHAGQGGFPSTLKVEDKQFKHGWCALTKTGFVTIDDREDEKKHTLNRLNLEAGLKLAASNHPQLLNRIVGGEYDAGDADAVVQLAIFGDVIYG